ncbi:MAG: hypothetical protein PUA93_01800 [Eubacteriales bacterium]|nr:hypothetical protein [Eubacteriales bacterium]
MFYTNNAYRSTDKAHCERNHELFRYIMPKGNSLDSLSQEDIDSSFSDSNSYARKELNGKSPCELFARAFSEEVLKRLGITKKNPDD